MFRKERENINCELQFIRKISINADGKTVTID